MTRIGRRMAQLRHRKQQLAKSEAIQEWSQRTGRSSAEWWKTAQEAGLTRDSTVDEKIAFLRGINSQEEELREEIIRDYEAGKISE